MAWDMLVSPVELTLSNKVYEKCQAAIAAFYKLSRKPEYAAALEPVPGVSPKPYHSVLMAYDFHTDENGDCSLVEINTNASGYMFTSLMQMTHTGNETLLPDLQRSFENEWKLFGGNGTPNVAITDNEIAQQKMYPEFVMFRDWFKSFGWNAELVEGQEFAGQNFVYNRLTDFYLEDHPALREAFVKNQAVISPNPYEYWLLGDKQRLIQLGQPEFLTQVGAAAEQTEAISKVLIPSFDKSSFESEEAIWTERKSLFFKPKRSHGGKSVYRGESVSKKVFERLMQEDILIQRYRAAQRVPTDDPRSVLVNWKFDLRFFVYEDRIQACVARIYQGQVTNFSSPMGGFTLVKFV